MLLRDVQKIIDAEVLVGADKLDMEVQTGFAADLMSDVLAYAVPGCILLTGLTNQQIIRTADVLDIAAIILVRGKKPSQETLLAAAEKKIAILSTRYILFETVGRLYQNGIVGCVVKVDEPRAHL